MTRVIALALALVSGAACATVAPPVPRFVAVYEQRSARCWIHVLRDTRSTACFVAFRCGRQPVQVLPAAPDVCIP